MVAANDSLTLSGKVANAASLSQALALAKAFALEGKVNNLVDVGGVHQVMLEVRVAEMSRTLTRRLGINFAVVKGDQSFFVNSLANLSQVVKPEGRDTWRANTLAKRLLFGVTALFRFNTNNTTWTGFIDALKEDGLIKVLAEPNLITLSGQTATFLAGGEFPVPVPQGLGTVAIEYKPLRGGAQFYARSFSPTTKSASKWRPKFRISISPLPDHLQGLSSLGFAHGGLRPPSSSGTARVLPSPGCCGKMSARLSRSTLCWATYRSWVRFSRASRSRRRRQSWLSS